MRQIVLDTETTGLSPKEGHRIIEIGCVELIDRRVTRNNFHCYLNPEREIDRGALNVHGLSNEFLNDKPLFKDVVDEFIEFVKGAELIIHNAAFDVGFINYELKRLRRSYGKIEQHCGVFDTLALARKMHPGQKNNLDALVRRYDVDHFERNLHGALLDSKILAYVYLAMTGGQETLFTDSAASNQTSHSQNNEQTDDWERPKTPIIVADEKELSEHEKYLDMIAEKNGQPAVWSASEDTVK